MKLKERLIKAFAPADERAHLDRKLASREARVRRLEEEQIRLERLTKMLDVKGGEFNGR